MYISKIIIHGYRSIEHAEIELCPGKNIIVGRNNSGKSNIVKAIDMLLGEKHPSFVDVSSNDFYINDLGVKVDKFWIACKLEGKDINFDEIRPIKGLWRYICNEDEPFYKNEDSNIEIDEPVVFFDPDDKQPHYQIDRSNPNLGGRRYFKNGEDINELIESMKQVEAFYFTILATPDGNRTKTEYRMVYKDKAIGEWCVIWNIPNSLRESFATSAILPSFREPNIQLRINDFGWYGKLLRSVWLEAEKEIGVQDGVLKAISNLQSIGDPIFNKLTENINSKLRIGFRDSTVRFQFVASAPTDIHKQVQIYVNDGLEDSISRKGSGIQSAIIIGLFSYYCSDKHTNTSILVVEEPEVYLHPHARKAMSRRLDDFVNLNSNKNNQVIVTTHSMEIIKSGNAQSISVVSKRSGKTESRTLKVFDSSFNPQELQQILRSDASELFFADKVILCEGSEHLLISKVADELIGVSGSLDERNISVINASGKHNFKTYAPILDKVGVECYIIADLDYLLHGLEDMLKIKKLPVLIDELASIIEQFTRHFELPKQEILKRRKTTDIPIKLREKVDLYRMKILKQLNIYILEHGSLENYVNKEELGSNLLDRANKVSQSLLGEVCRDSTKSISQYFSIEEFEYFINNIVLHDDPFDLHGEDLRQQLISDK